jgi:DNA-binding transcriptional LysR family regulator
MSRVLGRFRDMVGDPLFIRQGQNLMPTEKALTLNQSLNEPLEALRSLMLTFLKGRIFMA